jgi:hypothetical protein
MPMSLRMGINFSPYASNSSRELHISLARRLSSGPNATWTSRPGDQAISRPLPCAAGSRRTSPLWRSSGESAQRCSWAILHGWVSDSKSKHSTKQEEIRTDARLDEIRLQTPVNANAASSPRPSRLRSMCTSAIILAALEDPPEGLANFGVCCSTSTSGASAQARSVSAPIAEANGDDGSTNGALNAGIGRVAEGSTRLEGARGFPRKDPSSALAAGDERTQPLSALRRHWRIPVAFQRL